MLTLISVLLLVGAGLTVYFVTHPNRSNIIDVDVADGTSSEVRFESLALIPGASSSYTVRLNSEVTDEYEVVLEFDGTASAGLCENLVVEIDCKGMANRKTAKLTELLSGKSIIIYDTLTEGEPYEIKITYHLPESVGNEAQNTEASFDLTIKTSNAGGFYE